MGLEAKKLLPAKFRNYPLYRDVIIPLLQRYLDLSQEEFKTIGNKYKNFQDVPDEAILEIVSELGYEYILEGVSLNSEDKKIIYGYLKLIHLLKGCKKGLRFVIEILGYDFDEYEWYENAENIAYTRNQLMEGPADLQVDPYTYKVALNILLEEFEIDRIKKFSKFSNFYVYDILNLFLNLSFDLASLTINFAGFIDQTYSNDSGVIGTNYLHFGGFVDQKYNTGIEIPDPPECFGVGEIGFDFFTLTWDLCDHSKIFYVKYDESLEKTMVYYFEKSSTSIVENKLTTNTLHDEKNIRLSRDGTKAVLEIDFYDNGNNQLFIHDFSTGILTQASDDSDTLFTTSVLNSDGTMIYYSKNYEGLFGRPFDDVTGVSESPIFYSIDFESSTYPYIDNVDFMEYGKYYDFLYFRKNNKVYAYGFYGGMINELSNLSLSTNYYNFDTIFESPEYTQVLLVGEGMTYNLFGTTNVYDTDVIISSSNISSFKPISFVVPVSYVDEYFESICLLDETFTHDSSGTVYYITNNGTTNTSSTVGTITGLLYFCDKYVDPGLGA